MGFGAGKFAQNQALQHYNTSFHQIRETPPMPNALTLLLNITAADADQSDALTRALLRELRDSDLVEQATLRETTAPDGAKGAWGDWLKITFTPQNLQKLVAFIIDRLPGQPIIELELECG